MISAVAGRVSVVTGSESGIGRAIALKLADAGGSVVCVDLPRGGDPSAGTAAVIAHRGGVAAAMSADVRSEEQMRDVVDGTIATFGRLDVMVNNAGIFTRPERIEHQSAADFQRTMDTNAFGTWLGCKLAIATMAVQEPTPAGSRGRIINIASVAATVGLLRQPAYAASKGAVLSLTRQLAADYAGALINVNSVSPGFIATALTADLFAREGAVKGMQARTPWPRLGTPDDVAAAVAFLASDDAQWITGASLAVDGGLAAS